jgi:hypothetical protein
VWRERGIAYGGEVAKGLSPESFEARFEFFYDCFDPREATREIPSCTDKSGEDAHYFFRTDSYEKF